MIEGLRQSQATSVVAQSGTVLAAVDRAVLCVDGSFPGTKGAGQAKKTIPLHSSSRISPVLSLAEILEAPHILEPPQPVVPRLCFRGYTTLLVAREKGGKSTYCTAAGAAVSRGGQFLSEHLERGNVLWVALDEAIPLLVQRLVYHGAEPTSVFILDRRGADSHASLAEAAEDIQPALIVVDTLDKYALAHNLNKSDASGWSHVMDGLAQVTRQVNAATLIVHHATKESGRYRDSTAIGAGVDVIATMRPGDEASVRRFEVEARFSVGNFAVRLTGLDSEKPEYELAAGEMSLDVRVLKLIGDQPGASQRQVRSGVTGRNADIVAVLDRLQQMGEINDNGDGTKSRYVIAGTPL